MNRAARREDARWPTHCDLCGRRLGKFGQQWAFVAGNALCANPIPIIVPCHRVLHSTGGLGGYTGGLDRKRLLLDIERAQQSL